MLKEYYVQSGSSVTLGFVVLISLPLTMDMLCQILYKQGLIFLFTLQSTR